MRASEGALGPAEGVESIAQLVGATCSRIGHDVPDWLVELYVCDDGAS